MTYTSPSSSAGSSKSSENKIENINTTLNKVNLLIERIEADTKREFKVIIETQEKRFEDKMQQERVRVVEMLGIFIALFSFITINFNIFSSVTDLYTAAVFSSFVFCVLSAMIVLMDILLFAYADDRKIRKDRIRLLFLFILAIFVIIIIMGFNAFSLNSKSLESDNSCDNISVTCNNI